ncbi:MAG: transcriptional regulator [Spirochaetales bacterium]|nr:transcriptional regulator [Spirochaetales bacterium]
MTNNKDSDIAIKELSEVISKVDDAELLNDFFKQILTPREYEEIAKRWILVKMLNEGISQRNIAQELGISLCKITRGSRELKKENSAFRKLILKIGNTK